MSAAISVSQTWSSAWGSGMDKHLWVNGIGMTTLTPITKMMVHVPLSLQPQPPKKALVICFGMGTTFRSVLSWGVNATVVELVPSVPSLVGVFHPDAAGILTSFFPKEEAKGKFVQAPYTTGIICRRRNEKGRRP